MEIVATFLTIHYLPQGRFNTKLTSRVDKPSIKKAVKHSVSLHKHP